MAERIFFFALCSLRLSLHPEQISLKRRRNDVRCHKLELLMTSWNLDRYIYIDRNVGGNCDNSSFPGMEDDTDIRGYNVLLVLCFPCSGYHTRAFGQSLFWLGLGQARYDELNR